MPPPRPSRPTPPAARRILPPRQLVLCVPTLHDAYTMLHIDPTAPLPHHALTQVVAAGAAIPNRGPPQPWGPVVCGRVVSVGPVQHGADTSHGLRARGMVSRCVMLGDVEGGGAEVALWLYDAQVCGRVYKRVGLIFCMCVLKCVLLHLYMQHHTCTGGVG